MKKRLSYGKKILKFQILILIFINSIVFSQTVPLNTRLIQLNTSRGSNLSLTSNSNNYTYHIGTMSSSEVGFDNLSATNVGIDDMYILKSNAYNGANAWFKVFNSGKGGTMIPKYSYIDASENIYIFGVFNGSITVGNKTITSSNTNDTYLMKINSSGNAVWISYFSKGYNSSSKIKCVTDGKDTFLIYNQSHLARINDVNGDIISDITYNELKLKSITLLKSNLYVAGEGITGIDLGTEYVSSNAGFILKGDKNQKFFASVLTRISSTNNTDNSDINDIEADPVNSRIIMSGFSTNSINLDTESADYTYTFNPNSTFAYGMYNFSASIDENLSKVSYFRTSGRISSSKVLQTSNFDSKIVPSGGSEYKILLSITSDMYDIPSFTNVNNSVTTIPKAFRSWNLLLSCDGSGNYISQYPQPYFEGKMSASYNHYTQPSIANKLFTSYTFNAFTSKLECTKTKSSTIAGIISGQFQRHLNSAKSDLFFTSLIQGNADFFGSKVYNKAGISSRHITRLGADGSPRWFANFYPVSEKEELNLSQDFACVDKDDNFLVMCHTSGTSFNFVDGLGHSSSLSQNSAINSTVLVKLNKDGALLWSKQFKSGSDHLWAAITTDADGNVYVLGIANGNISFDNTTITFQGNSSAQVFIKFNSSGGLVYCKTYDNLSAASLIPVFDNQNNLYVFMEPTNGTGKNYYDYDGTIIPSVVNHSLEHLMLKFNPSGNVVFGKNFYASQVGLNYDYGWPYHVVFDGTDFIMLGGYFTTVTSTNFLGLDSLSILKVYPANNVASFLAKIKTDGTVVWQKPIHSSVNFLRAYTNTNIDIDEKKNVYMFCNVKDNISYNGTEYNFDAIKGNKVLLKIDNNGILKYYKAVDLGNILSPIIDVIGEDKINVSSYTAENNILNYPINNLYSSNLYIATFGNLDTKYLTPEKNYMLLSNSDISNNPNDANTFSFDLTNNVNWNATSDQSWLTLNNQKLTEKTISQTTISGTGDAKIILTAQTNNTGSNRSANVIFTGDSGVASKTVIITQTGALGTRESRMIMTTLYPNPTSDILNIQTEQKISIIEIYDISGKLMKKNDGKAKKILVSDLNKGLYLIKLYTENGIINSKFIKN